MKQSFHSSPCSDFRGHLCQISKLVGLAPLADDSGRRKGKRFIWGGRWYHFDTMHFEYRPELLDASCYPAH